MTPIENKALIQEIMETRSRHDHLPSLIGVAVGAIADPKYPAPVISVFEQSKHSLVQIDGAVEHFRQSSVAINSN